MLLCGDHLLGNNKHKPTLNADYGTRFLLPNLSFLAYLTGCIDDLNADFTFEEVEKIVKHAKNGKAPGIDGLIVDVMKNQLSIRILVALFNKCLRLQLMPSIWAKRVISPIPKSPDNNPRVPLNYRGISPLPVTSKLYTAAISSRLSNYFEKNNSLSNELNGFRLKRSCVDHIFTIHNLCKIRKNLRQDTFLTFIDFKKAFDYVNHDMLMYKLHHLGITGDLHKSIKNIYINPVSCVQLNGHLTDWFPIHSGVRQGDSLSPTLFAAFINDLSQEMIELNVGVKVGGECLNMLLYADDIVLISPSHEKAQQQLSLLANWCKNWNMYINSKKSQIMHIRNYQKPCCQKDLYCGDEKLQYTSTYKYLGFILHEHLQDKPTVDALTGAATRSFGRVVNIFKSLKNMCINSYETLYQSYILPILGYGAEVWGYGEQSGSQVLSNRVKRFYLGVNSFTPVSATSLEFDWPDVDISMACNAKIFEQTKGYADISLAQKAAEMGPFVESRGVERPDKIDIALCEYGM